MENKVYRVEIFLSCQSGPYSSAEMIADLLKYHYLPTIEPVIIESRDIEVRVNEQ